MESWVNESEYSPSFEELSFDVPNSLYNEVLDRATEEQRTVIDTKQGMWAVLAGPGSGKTATMTARIANLVYGGVPPENILMLTFTVKSANEMRERAIKLNPACQSVVSGTFHSVGLKLLRDPKFGNEFRWHVIDENAALTEFAYLAYGRFNDENQIDITKVFSSVKKDFDIEIEHVKSFYKNFKERSPKEAIHIFRERHPKIEEREKFFKSDMYAVKKIYSALKEFPEYKVARHMLELDDIVPEACKLLESRPDIRNYFQYVNVDEYQDTNYDQYRMSLLLSEGWGNLLCVGDDKQSIYRWRGANVENFMDIVEQSKDNVLHLSTNFRSCPEIVSITNISQNLIGQKIDTISMHSFLNVLENKQAAPAIFSSSNDQVNAIVEKVIQAHEQGIPWNEIAILLRSHKGKVSCSRKLQSEFLRYKIPMRIVGSSSIGEAIETKLSLAFVQLLQNIHERSAWVKILQILPQVKDITAMKYANKLYKSPNFMHIFKNFDSYLSYPKKEDKKEIFTSCVEKLKDIFASMDYFAEKQDSDSVSALLFEVDDLLEFEPVAQRMLFGTRIKDDLLKKERLKRKCSNMSYLREIASTVDDVEDFLDVFFTQRKEQSAEETDAVTISTIHSAKGLEWNTVFVPDMVENFFPSGHAIAGLNSTSEKERIEAMKMLDEEARLFYVAVSRAKKHLFLSAPLKNEFGDPLKLSRYFSYMNNTTSDLIFYKSLFRGFNQISFNSDSTIHDSETYIANHCDKVVTHNEKPERKIEKATVIDAIPF